MPDKFDPYREALIVETTTIWPEELAEIDPKTKEKVAAALHADPENATQLAYVRMHTGFCREITVTDGDVERLRE
ncbi:MAG: hypothetical protein AAGF97_00665 [Planctomycetota bacterium]